MKSKMITRIGQIVAVFCLFNAFAFSQRVAEEGSEVLLDRTKPPVFIEFVRTGKCKKGSSNFNFGDLCNSKSEHTRTFDAAWLRLVNNSRWSIGVTLNQAATDANANSVVIESTTYTDENGERFAYVGSLAKSGAEMDVVYKSEAETGCDFNKRAPKGQSCYRIQVVAPQIPLPSLSSTLFVAPGQSIVFPINRDHVIKYVNLYVLYNFAWEYSGQHFSHFPHYDSQHRAFFGWFDLEKGIKTERERKTLAMGGKESLGNSEPKIKGIIR